MNERTRNLMLPALAGLLLVIGCASTKVQPPPGEPLQIAGTTRDEAMDAAEIVLSGMHFPLTKNDHDNGVMRTGPLSGAQFFEFWRADNATLDDALEANLHTIRRSVELDFDQTDGQLSVRCIVRVQRLSLPEKDIPSVSQAYRIYSRSTRDTQRLKLYPEQMKDLTWVDLGQDPALADEVLKRITRQITKPQKAKAT